MMTMTPNISVTSAGDVEVRARYHVVLASESGWDVSMERDGHVVAVRHCSNWHAVERLCAQLDAQTRSAEDYSAAAR